MVWHCHVLTAAETSTVVPTVKPSTGFRWWQDGGSLSVVRQLPLLPGQTGCPDLPSPDAYW